VLRRGLFRNQQGVAAIEFGILAPIFFILLVVLIDLSIFFAVHSIVDDAVENAARAIRIGQLTADDTKGTKFRQVLCGQIFFLNCNNFTFTVQPTDDLSKVDPKPKLDDDGNIEGSQYKQSKPEDYVVITIVYVHRFIIPYAGEIFGDDGLSDPYKRAIISFLVIRNEPFPG
jgi:Flp pilus assembly pilin Flp